jgi:6-phosphogluconolactonase/glucosamine-6-phosphate isomerase/deaminase
MSAAVTDCDSRRLRDDPAAHAATLFARAAMCTLATRTAFHAALCGGALLATTLAALARLPAFRRIDWRHVHVYAVDDSWDEAAMSELAATPLLRENVRRPRGADMARHDAARRYEQQLTARFALPAGAVPVFDFMLLEADGQGRVAGFSREGHGAANVTRLVVAHERGLPRVALGLPVIDAARSIALTCDSTCAPCLELLNPKGALHVLSPSTARSSGAATPPTGRASRSALPPA